MELSTNPNTITPVLSQFQTNIKGQELTGRDLARKQHTRLPHNAA